MGRELMEIQISQGIGRPEEILDLRISKSTGEWGNLMIFSFHVHM